MKPKKNSVFYCSKTGTKRKKPWVCLRNRLLVPLGMICLLFLSPELKAQYTFGDYGVSAYQIGGNYYQVLPAINTNTENKGSFWNMKPTDLSKGFDYTFWMNFGDDIGGMGADGIAFVMQASNPNTAGTIIGSGGGGIGYGLFGGSAVAITPSVAVEFDTWWNTYTSVKNEFIPSGYSPTDDPNEGNEVDHIDIRKNGVMANENFSLMPSHQPVAAWLDGSGNPKNIDDGKCHKVRFHWVPGTSTSDPLFEVYFEDMSTPRVSINLNLPDYFSATQAQNIYWGFTSGSWTGYNNQYVAFIDGWDAVHDPIICKGSSIKLGPNLVTSGFSYTWEIDNGDGTFTYLCKTGDPNGHTDGSQPTVSPTATTTYKVTMTDNDVDVCPIYDEVTVTVEDLEVSLGSTMYNCNGGGVTITPTITGASSDDMMTYSWTSTPSGFTASTSSITVNPTSNITYHLTVTNSRFGNVICTKSADQTVDVSSLAVTASASPTTISCGGSSTLNAVVSPTQTGTMSYAWVSSPSGFTSSLQSPVVSPGTTTTYTVTATNTTTGCQDTKSVTVTISGSFTVSLPLESYFCTGPVNLSPVVDPAQPGATYSWTNTVSGYFSSASSVNVSPTAEPESYTVVVTNEEGCSASATTNIVEDHPDFAFCNSYNICYKESVVPILLGMDQSLGDPWTYLWTCPSNPSSISDPHALFPVLSPTVTTNYTITVTTAHGCSGIETITVNVEPKPKPFEDKYDHGTTVLPLHDDVRCITRSDDCGFLMAGSTDNAPDPQDMCLVKTDDAGNVVWSNVYINDPTSTLGHQGMLYYTNPVFATSHSDPCVPLTHQTGYISTGIAAEPAYCPNDDMAILLTNTSGAIVHSATYGNAANCDRGFCIQQTKDKGFIAVGMSESWSLEEPGGTFVPGTYTFLVKTKSDLTLQWSYLFGLGDNEGLKVIQLADNGYMIAGYIKDNSTVISGTGDDILVMRLASDGTLTWVNKYYPVGKKDNNSTEYGSDLIQAPDGNFLVFGSTNSTNGYGGNDAYVFEIDGDGVVQWSKVIGSTADENGKYLKMNAAGQIVYMMDVNNPTTMVDVCMAKSVMNPPSLLDQKTFFTPGSTMEDDPGNFIIMPGGEYVLAYSHQNGPESSTPPDPLSDMNLVRTNNVGSTGCEEIPTLSVKDIQTNSIDIMDYFGQADMTSANILLTYDQMTLTPVTMNVNTVCNVTASCADPGSGGPSLTTDMDFSTVVGCGTAYFSSDLSPQCVITGPPFGMGDYALVTNAATVNPTWVGLDHTGNGSDILVGTGSMTADLRAWYQTVPVMAGEKYILCAWGLNVSPNDPTRPSLQVKVGGMTGQLIAEEDNLNASDGWINIAGIYSATTTGSVELDMIIKQGLQPGNDFAVDDIGFYHISPPGPGPLTMSVKDGSFEKDASKVYPNPVKQGDDIFLYYNASKDQKAHISIVDINGKVISYIDKDFKQGDNAAGFRTLGLSPGIYDMRIEVNGNISNNKFVIAQP